METLEKKDDGVITLSENYEIAEIYKQVFPAVAKSIRSRGGSFEELPISLVKMAHYPIFFALIHYYL